ncbi:MAG: hypothetical protein ACRD98_02415 [Nitrososphaera sp.]
MAIFASRTVDAILQWRVHAQSSSNSTADRIEWTRQASRSANVFLAPAWHKTEHGTRGAKAVLVLPFRLLIWLSQLDAGIGAPRLTDLLPISEIAWSKRAYACLAKALNCSNERAELITRDLIPRLVYHDTANSALVRFWRSSSSDLLNRRDRIALNHYLQLGSVRSLKSFAKACKTVFDEESMSDRHEVNISLRSGLLQPYETAKINQALMRVIQTTESIPAKLSGVAHLVLFACLAGTGHRRCTKPFPFPWDFNIPEKLVFIADKLVTGSEARFVPLAPTVIQYLEFYADHLYELSLSDEAGPSVRDYARVVEKFLRTSISFPTQAVTVSAPLSAGVFFSVSSDGSRVKKWTISTHQLDFEIKRLTGLERVTQRLRPTLANHLWEAGASGRSVQTLLGHQPELHSHGPSSTWSVREWADGLEPLIENYLIEYGISLGGSYNPRRPCHHSGAIPPLRISGELGYEGRQREREWAQQRARALIRREINEHVLFDDETVITEEDFQEVAAKVRVELQYDPVALAQVAGELKKQLAAVRRRRTVTVSASSAYLGATAPGPVGIDFSRSLRCANVFRQLWELNVGVAIGVNQFDPIERLAHLAISLVCFDGVLHPLHLKGIIEAMGEGPTSHSDGVSLRGRVLSPTHDYDFSVLPGRISTALCLGVKALPAVMPGSKPLWTVVHERAALILRKLMNSNQGGGWDLQQLCLIFRPYWFIRQPGAMYAVTIGDYRGPAADPASEALLLGESPAMGVMKLTQQNNRTTGKSSKAMAYQELRKFFTDSRGAREKGQKTKKKQRAALRAALNSESAIALMHWRSETQIVDLLFSFIGRLLDKGGKRVKTLAFSSLEKYFSLIAKELLDLGWNINFESIAREELTHLLETASARLSDKSADSVLAYFNTHLRDEIGTPFCGPKWSDAWDPIRVRASLVLPRQTSKAISILNKDESDVSHYAALLIELMAGYGVRTSESLGLSAKSFDLQEPDFLQVKGGRISDLKTPNGRRALFASLNSESLQLLIRGAVAKARTSPHKEQYLFEDSTANALISNVNACTAKATEALRLATGNPTAVPYHLRHSFCTALVLGVFALRDQGLHAAATRVLGGGYETRIRRILQSPADWPFAPTSAGQLMGHSGVATLLNTYFHASSLVIAARCGHWQPIFPLSDARLGAMLDRERSGLTKLRRRLPAREGTNKSSWQEVVQHLLQESRNATDNGKREPQDDQNDGTERGWDRSWVVVARMLVHRLASNASLEDMATFANGTLGVPLGLVSEMLIGYQELVAETELDDFEPVSSTLTRPVASHNRGVTRGELERDRFLARVQKWLESPSADKERFGRFMRRWKERVNAASPRIICINQNELDDAVFILERLGADSSQLIFETHGDPHDSWLDQVASSKPIVKQSKERGSRGSNRVLVREVSITVAQKSGQEFPDGRDLHRALVSVHVAWSVLLKDSQNRILTIKDT